MLKTIEQPPLVTIRFQGDLAEKFGAEHQARGYSVPELIKGVCVNQPALKTYLYDTGVEFKACRGEAQIENEDQLCCPVAADCLTLKPYPAGSGGVGRLLGGIALLGIGLGTGGTSLAIAGLAATFSAASQLISGKNKTPGTKTERDNSFLFDSFGGAANDNDPVPLPYGEGPSVGIPLSLAVSTSDI